MSEFMNDAAFDEPAQPPAVQPPAPAPEPKEAVPTPLDEDRRKGVRSNQQKLSKSQTAARVNLRAKLDM